MEDVLFNVIVNSKRKMVAEAGFEPATFGL
jgi:hypothetical protein